MQRLSVAAEKPATDNTLTSPEAWACWLELQRGLRHVGVLRQPPTSRRRRCGEMRVTLTERRAMQAFHLFHGETYTALARRFRRDRHYMPRWIWDPSYRAFHAYYWGTNAGHRIVERRGRRTVDSPRPEADESRHEAVVTDLQSHADALLRQMNLVPPREPREALRPIDEATILELAATGKSQTEIAGLVGCHQSTVSRTLAEWTDSRGLARKYARSQVARDDETVRGGGVTRGDSEDASRSSMWCGMTGWSTAGIS